MKLFRNILIATSALALAAVSCQQVEEGKGDATIGFENPTYVYKESAGRVKLQVKFEGEPKTYPITFDVVVTPEGGLGLDSLVHFTQTENLKYMGNPDAPAYIEFDLKDNDYINDSRFLTFTLANVKGAEIVAGGKTMIEIADNDNNPYERLMGNWVAQCYDSDGAKAEWNVNISGGFTSDEENVNFEKTLVCWGFGGQMEDVSSYGITPAKQPVWYLTYDAEAKTLTTQPGKVMANIWKFNGIDEDVEVKIATGAINAEGKMATDHAMPMTATWSADMSTITFEPDYFLVATVWGVSGEYYGYWMAFNKIVLVRK
jgi:hypothetical protein